MPLPPLGERVATGAREVDGVYLYQGYPNYVVKVQTRDIDTKYTPEQVTSINRARSARKKVIQDALLSLPAGDRVPIARHAFGEGYFVQPFIRGGMELQEFQRLYPQAWERIREEYRRRMRMMTQRSTESMRRWFRETPDRPATHGDLLAGTAEPDVRAANFMVQIPPAGPNAVNVNHIVWVDW